MLRIVALLLFFAAGCSKIECPPDRFQLSTKPGFMLDRCTGTLWVLRGRAWSPLALGPGVKEVEAHDLKDYQNYQRRSYSPTPAEFISDEDMKRLEAQPAPTR